MICLDKEVRRIKWWAKLLCMLLIVYTTIHCNLWLVTKILDLFL